MQRQRFKRLDLITGNRLWTPARLATAGWYDASDLGTITHSSGAVSQWNDKSGNNRHLTQVTGAAQPTTNLYTLNKLNVLYFDGGDFLEKTSFTTGASTACIMVARFDTINNASDAAFSFNASKDFGLVANNASQFNGAIVCVGASNPATTAFSGGPFPGPSIYEGSVNTSGLRIRGWVDGVMRADVSYIGAISGSCTFRVFADRSAAQFSTGIVSEVIVLNTPSASNQQLIEGYLAWKWGLVDNLAVTHPYKYIPPKI